jgi:hypothetical protein
VPYNRYHIDFLRQDFKEFALRELWRVILAQNKSC